MRSVGYGHYVGRRKMRTLLKGLLAIFFMGIIFFILLEVTIAIGDKDIVRGEPDVMIILGCKVQPWGEPSTLLKDRLNKALDYLGDHPNMIVVVSGGKGADEPEAEADVMAAYLIDNGYPAENILKENESFSTWENLTNSLELLDSNGFDTTADILIVSNGFHLSRVHFLWRRLNGTWENLSTLAAPSSHRLSRWKMFFREPVGLIKSFVFDR